MTENNKSILSKLIDNIISSSLPTRKNSSRDFLRLSMIDSLNKIIKDTKWFKRKCFKVKLLKTLKSEVKLLKNKLSEKSSLSNLVEESFSIDKDFDVNAQKAYFLFLLKEEIVKIRKQIKIRLKTESVLKATLKEFSEQIRIEGILLNKKMKIIEKALEAQDL